MKVLRRSIRIVAAIVVAIATTWLVLSTALYAAMRQTPEDFGAIMSHAPELAMVVLPFKPLWMSARAGHLNVGDPAPDFTLPVLKSDHSVTLSTEYRHKPVVLVFGSYT